MYKIVRIRVTDDGRPEGLAAVEDFVAGWFADGRVSGRLVRIVLKLDEALYCRTIRLAELTGSPK